MTERETTEEYTYPSDEITTTTRPEIHTEEINRPDPTRSFFQERTTDFPDNIYEEEIEDDYDDEDYEEDEYDYTGYGESESAEYPGIEKYYKTDEPTPDNSALPFVIIGEILIVAIPAATFIFLLKKKVPQAGQETFSAQPKDESGETGEAQPDEKDETEKADETEEEKTPEQ